jgi:hypothetical protein
VWPWSQSAVPDVPDAAPIAAQPAPQAPLPPPLPSVEDPTLDYQPQPQLAYPPVEAPPLQLPDAVTDPAGTPSAGELAGVTFEARGDPGKHYQKTASEYAGRPLEIPDDVERERALSELDPVALAQLELQHERDRAAMVEQRRRTATDSYIEGERQSLADRQAAYRHAQERSDSLIADATRIANTKVDPSGGVHGTRLVAGVLASIVGGLVQGRTGSPHNGGLDALMQTINNGIDAQKADLANQRDNIGLRRSVLAEEYARTGDMQAAEDRVRLASLKLAEDMLATDAQNWDPRGTTAINKEKLRRGIIGQQQAIVDASRQKGLENGLKLQDAARQQQIADQTALHDRQQIGLGYAQLDSAAADRKAAAEARVADKAIEKADKEAERDRQFSVGGVPHLVLDADGKPVAGADGQPAVSYDALRNADGRVWRASSPEEHKVLREKKTAATQLIKLYDRALALRDKVGGESGTFNSAEYQELKGIEKEILLLKKAGTSGMSSDKDMDNLVDAAGANDITSFRSRTPGIEAARARTIDNLNQEYRDANYTGPTFRFPPSKSTTNTTDEDATQALLAAPDVSFDDEIRKELGARQRAAGREGALDVTNNPADQALYHGAYEAVRSDYDPTASRDQQRKIAELGAAAVGTSPEALAAAAKLQRIATSAQTSKLRELAQQALQSSLSAGLPGSPAAQGHDRGVSYETVPPAGRGR